MHFPVFFLLFIFLIKCQSTIAESKKPYDVEIRSFEPYKNVGTDDFDPKTLRVNRKDRNNYVLSGDFTLFTNLGVDSTLVYQIMKKSDTSNSYTTVLKGSANICHFCSTNKNFYPRFRTFTNFPEPNTCPFPKGNYTVKDYTLDDQFLPAAIPSGAYILKASYTRDNQVIFGFTVTFNVSPSS